jgi:hypothetical protein
VLSLPLTFAHIVDRLVSYVANQEKGQISKGERIEDLLIHIDRLYVAKRSINKRIIELGGGIDLAVDISRQVGPC